MSRLNFRYIGFFIVSLVLQIHIVKYVEIASWKPDLLLIAIVMFAIQYGQTAGSSAGFFLGMASDLISGGLLGLSALAKSITGFTAGGVAKFFQERIQFVLTLLISGLVHDLIYIFINTLGKGILWRVIFFVHIVPNLFYTALVGLAINFLIGKWLKGHE